MEQQFGKYLEELSIHEGELKELERIIQRCNINISSLKKQALIMYKNHVESLIEAGDWKKNLQKILVILQLSAIISKKVQRYQDLNNNLQHRSNKDLTQKINVVNKVLATKESS